MIGPLVGVRETIIYLVSLQTFFFRNRVAVQLQKNLDRVRLRRIQQKLSTSESPASSGYEISRYIVVF